MDIYKYIGKNIKIKLYRRGKTHEHTGILVDINKSEICLLNNQGRHIWIPRPMRFRDEIKEAESL